ncbi:hypothetical protein BFP70_18820 [Thioclava sp. SK-1]|nr:hypothetical protein BFP70_18820 [Thioclava sp. SK-1]
MDFTHEDRAAKGLRVFCDDTAAPQVAVQFTAFEMVSMHRAQLLHAPRGGGKTTLACSLHAALSQPAPAADVLTAPVIRNPQGTTLPQIWDCGAMQVQLGQPGQGMAALAAATARAGAVLLILDGMEQEPDPSALVEQAMAWIADTPGARLLALCESGALESIRLHRDLRSHALLPLLKAQRCAALAALGLSDPVTDLWVSPGLWALSVAQGRALDLRTAAAVSVDAAWLQEARDSLALERMLPQQIIEHVKCDPVRWSGALRLAAQRHRGEAPLATALAQSGCAVALLAAADMIDLADDADAAAMIARLIAQAIEGGGLAVGMRRRAGAALARLGDPRALDQMVDIAAGIYQMGGDVHPNSAPGHQVTLPAFRIGMYPVTCGAYAKFVRATGRTWLSSQGQQPSRASHPATDLTWHDAQAYCAWLAHEWRALGRLPAGGTLRLPTEREWEAAARGPAGRCYPWGETWHDGHANDEETGFNDICTVGLFPEGAAASGCLDMAGQVWEWCTTLWGDHMTTPSFHYPWAPDGRERLDAPAQIRRVLRGGCFSSGRAKANGIYRGSLEPMGFWRGNGFRIVMA